MMWSEPTQKVMAYLIGAAFIFFLWRIGVWDDCSELNYKFKFLGQFIGVLLLIFIGDVKIIYFPFLGLVRYRITLPYPFDVSQTYIRFS